MSFFRCKLPLEVVDVEVKITSMQGTHIFRRDQTTQLIQCTPWSTRLCPHPTIIKKMKTFLEVEGKMGPIPAPISQFRPHCQIPTPTLESAMPQRKGRGQHLRCYRPATPKPTAVHLPLPEAPPKPKNDAPLPSIPVCKSTPWPGTGKISGNLFEDRNWLLPPKLSGQQQKKTRLKMNLKL